MKSGIGVILVVIGVVILLFGIAAPSTTTQSATTCYDDPTGFGQDCVRSSYEAPNTGKSGLIGAGIFMAIVGIFLLRSDSSSVESSFEHQSSERESSSLQKQIQERQSRQDTDGKYDGESREK